MATLVAIGLWVLHFRNPYPLIQIPDRGHRLFALPDKRTHDLLLEVLWMAGAPAYGTFFAGVNQTLMMDGFTVLAYGEGIHQPAISIPVENPWKSAAAAQDFLSDQGVHTSLMYPSEELGDKLVLLRLPFGWDIVFRLNGKDMPPPQWIAKFDPPARIG